jgi:ubiquinone/menaquinone biosynthesis C-methylase UbiE
MPFASPSDIVVQFGLQPGDRVADLGAGSGEFTFAAQRAVGGSGRVFAIEVQKELVPRIKNSAQGMNLPRNLEVIWGDVEEIGGSELRDGAVNGVIAANLLFQLEDRDNFVNEVNRILKPGGRVLLVDWSDSFGNTGPRPEDVVRARDAEALFERRGFTLERSIDAGDHHWAVVLRKN